MSLSFTLTRDDISPALRRLLATARNPVPVLRAMGTTFKSITEGTFNSVGASYRPTAWRAKREGGPSNLQKSTTLAKSFHLEVTSTYARLSNAAIYAAIHQFGGVIRPKAKKALRFQSGGKWFTVGSVTMPARPFYPVLNGRLTPSAEVLIGNAARRVIAGEKLKA